MKIIILKPMVQNKAIWHISRPNSEIMNTEVNYRKIQNNYTVISFKSSLKSLVLHKRSTELKWTESDLQPTRVTVIDWQGAVVQNIGGEGENQNKMLLSPRIYQQITAQCFSAFSWNKLNHISDAIWTHFFNKVPVDLWQ